MQDLPIDHDAAADPRAHREVSEIVLSLPGAALVLTERGQAGVIIHQRFHAVAIRHLWGQGFKVQPELLTDHADIEH